MPFKVVLCKRIDQIFTLYIRVIIVIFGGPKQGRSAI